MTSHLLFITGTDTAVGKSVLAGALIRRLRQLGKRVSAVKPFCSGGRGDARALRRALGAAVPLDAINPWHFRAALAPALAARTESLPPTWLDAVRHIRSIAAQHEVTVVEGAGGLLSPLTMAGKEGRVDQDGDARHLIRALRAFTLVVSPNRLGAINQTLLVLQALPTSAAQHARVVLMSQARPDSSARLNREYLQERLGRDKVVEFPRLTPGELNGRVALRRAVCRVLDRILSDGAGGIRLGKLQV